MHDWFFDNVFPVIFVLAFIMTIFSWVKKFSDFKSSSGLLDDTFDKLDLEIHKPIKRQTKTTSKSYGCRRCGANLAGKVDVSPGGDVKCEYCDQWFNIYSNSQ